ncbi:hypothetical protein EV361DRAFT_929340 [Lentinula raphanica]|uniref:Uncharacterized protein n=1 Tax=Lentinula raphanica TaxID=153919 RepID=A0AA38PAP6_9AGAR|nr:hypothetical protein C8R42DRAFT_688534 [Lentinula raphanica]KAJ3769072.1 hypothetical protein FB446DRAFT_238132 [Lentinula raphanica]KAJ3824986.1 hypothetical protein F5880DRAFT_294135 [Lentinula raphanica]KAJ3839452.1 hypothetical protein F5878DRAFT_660276 [Lentinula raphanica]KAJ3967722.1 hypothetical protein EV361DRAFT_929340 [Lentinula raphanica]
MSLNSYESTLLAAFFTSILFGFYISTALRCSLIIWGRYKAKGSVHPYLLVTHIALVFLVTTRCIAVLIRAMLPSVHQTYTIRNTWSWDTLFVDSLWMIALLVSDAFVCFRAYVVWARNIYIQIFPIILLIANVVFMCLRLIMEANSKLAIQDELKYIRRLQVVTMGFMIATVVLNVFNTSMIAYRIWSVRRRTASSRTLPQDMLSNLVSLLVESAAIYTVVLVVDIILLGLGKILFLVFNDIQTPLIGIVFSSIIISVTQGSAFGDTSGGGGGTSGDHVTWPRTSQGRGHIPTEINMHTIVTTQKDPIQSPIAPDFGKTTYSDSSPEPYGRDYIDLGGKPDIDDV